MQLALEYCGLAFELLRLIVLGEGYVYVKLIIYVMTDNLLLKAGDKLTRTELE